MRNKGFPDYEIEVGPCLTESTKVDPEMLSQISTLRVEEGTLVFNVCFRQ